MLSGEELPRSEQTHLCLFLCGSVFILKPIFQVVIFFYHLQQDKGSPLPKFGEWDVNNPASAEGFTVIFNKARDEKKTGSASGAPAAPPPQTNYGGYKQDQDFDHFPKKVVLCGYLLILQGKYLF